MLHILFIILKILGILLLVILGLLFLCLLAVYLSRFDTGGTEATTVSRILVCICISIGCFMRCRCGLLMKMGFDMRLSCLDSGFSGVRVKRKIRNLGVCGKARRQPIRMSWNL